MSQRSALFFLSCIRWPLQVYCCRGGVPLWCWYVRRASGFGGVTEISLIERNTDIVVFLTAFSICVSLLRTGYRLSMLLMITMLLTASTERPVFTFHNTNGTDT